MSGLPQINLSSPVQLSKQDEKNEHTHLSLPIPRLTPTLKTPQKQSNSVQKVCDDLKSIPTVFETQMRTNKYIPSRNRTILRSPKTNNYCNQGEGKLNNTIPSISSQVENYERSSNSDQENSLPSGISWSSNEHDSMQSVQEQDLSKLQTSTNTSDHPSRRLLSPRMLLALLSPIQSERAPSRDSRTTSRMSNREDVKSPRSFTPQEVKVSIGGRENSFTQIFQLTPQKSYIPPITDGGTSTPRPIIRLFPSNSVSRQGGTVVTSFSQRPFNITITPPVLPLCFANALLTLYAVNEPGVDCKLHLLAFCLAAGSLTLFMSVLAIVAGCAVKEAVADGRVSEEERKVIWYVANQNNFLLGIQILTFMSLFGYVIYYFDKVNFTDFENPYFCKRNVYVVCFVLSVVMVTTGFIAIIVFIWLRVVDTRREPHTE